MGYACLHAPPHPPLGLDSYPSWEGEILASDMICMSVKIGIGFIWHPSIQILEHILSINTNFRSHPEYAY